MTNNNIVLIGMPSSGKSTIGKLIATNLGLVFMDTDKLILEKENRALKDIVIQDGLDAFLDIQENTILDLNADNTVISTGGGVVYRSKSMEHLRSIGKIFYLRYTLEEIVGRLEQGRRFARNDGQTLEDVYKERVPLYEKYSDKVIECSNRTVDDIAKEITNEYIAK